MLQLRLGGSPPTPQLVLKAIMIGDSGVGKSCLGLRCVGQPFRRTHDITIGVEFLSCSLLIKDQLVKIHIWDTAGQESFRSITRSYYRTASLCFLVYDVTNADTFRHIRSWHTDVQAHAVPDMVVALVGNKTDVDLQRRAIHEADAEQLAGELGLSLHFEVSALSGDGVQEAFRDAVAAAAAAKHSVVVGPTPPSVASAPPCGARSSHSGCC